MTNPNFYNIMHKELSDHSINLSFTLNPQHQIFEGHFPGNPILPGVCMVQMVNDALTLATEKSYLLTEASQIKFLEMIIPNHQEVLQLQMTWHTSQEQYSAKSFMYKNNKPFFKFQGTFSQIENN